jgi:hypothetical protein
LVELLVVIAIIGVLVALLLPAIQSAREAARRTQCINHLKQIGLSLHLFHDSYKKLPPARFAGGSPSWFAFILPYMEGAPQHELWDFGSSYYSAVNKRAREATLPEFFCPTRRSPNISSGEAPGRPGSGSTGDYAGCFGDVIRGCCPHDGPMTGVIITSQRLEHPVFVKGKPVWDSDVSFKNITDGLAHTLFGGEKHLHPQQLGLWPDDSSIYNGDHLHPFVRTGGPFAPVAKSAFDDVCCDNFGSWHPGVTQFLFGDNRVRTTGVEIDVELLHRLAVRNDNLPVQLDF